MCFVLYAGTDKPITRIEGSADSPAISVKDLTDRERPIAAHFTKQFVQYVGSTSGCGCNFPSVMFQNGDFRALPWTYPDYADHPLRRILTAVRLKYGLDLKRRAEAPERL